MEAVHKWFIEIPDQLIAGTAVRLLIVDPQRDTDLYGAVALFGIDASRRSAEIGCWLTTRSRGQGVAFRAVRLLVGWAFAKIEVAQVIAEVDADNHVAQGLLDRGGFACRGQIAGSDPKAIRYAITVADFWRIGGASVTSPVVSARTGCATCSLASPGILTRWMSYPQS